MGRSSQRKFARDDAATLSPGWGNRPGVSGEGSSARLTIASRAGRYSSYLKDGCGRRGLRVESAPIVLALQQTQRLAARQRLGARADGQLQEYPLDVRFHRFRRDFQCSRDSLVGQALADLHQNVALARGQRVADGCGRRNGEYPSLGDSPAAKSGFRGTAGVRDRSNRMPRRDRRRVSTERPISRALSRKTW